MRRSVVGGVRILSVQLSSVVQTGDSLGMATNARVLAIQRQVPVYLGNEGNLAQFDIFRQPVPDPSTDEPYQFNKIDACPDIKVGFIDIYGISTAAALQIGSTGSLSMDNRTKHIRQLLRGKRPV